MEYSLSYHQCVLVNEQPTPRGPADSSCGQLGGGQRETEHDVLGTMPMSLFWESKETDDEVFGLWVGLLFFGKWTMRIVKILGSGVLQIVQWTYRSYRSPLTFFLTLRP